MPDASRAPAADRARQRWSRSHTERKNGQASNSPLEDSYCPLFADSQLEGCGSERRIGVDTISWGWPDSGAVDRFLRLDGVVLPGNDDRPLRVVKGPGGSMKLSRRHPQLGTVGAFPGASLLYVEGRTHALAEGDDADHELGDVTELRRAQARVSDGIGELLGQHPRSKMALRRADLTGEILWDRGEDGQAFLGLLDGLHSPLYKTSPVREKGGPALESAYWRTPQRNVPVLRAYDKGVESGTAPPGTRIRLERQMRYGGKHRPTLEQWLERDLADLYSAPLRAWLRGGGLAAGTAEQLLDLLTDAAVIWPNYWASGSSWVSSSGAVHCSLWPARKVERVAGTLAMVARYGRSWPAWSPKQKQRRMMEVRQFGLLLTDQPVRVDIDQAVSSLCDLWRAAA